MKVGVALEWAILDPPSCRENRGKMVEVFAFLLFRTCMLVFVEAARRVKQP